MNSLQRPFSFSTLAVLGLLIVAIFLSMPRVTDTFPPVGVGCFDSFMEQAENGYADSAYNLPPFELSKISHFKCSSSKGSSQYEVEGIDTAGNSFYVHRIAGGMAASGADTYFDYCYMQNGTLIASEKLTGRTTREEGTCTYLENYPPDPLSSYEYNYPPKN